MCRHAAAALAMALFLTSCAGSSGGNAEAPRPTTRSPVPKSALDGMLLSAGDINTVMGTTAITPTDPFLTMDDHRNLLPNLNCLGIWQVGERAIYESSGWGAIRGQVLRQPNTDRWDALVVQAAVTFPSADAAQKFYAASSDRWSKCTNHRVNMTLNGQPQPTLTFGNLTKTGTELTMPVTRGAGDRTCQRALSVTNNVVLDVAACGTSVTNQAAAIVNAIQSKIPA
jgi:hypothetical protein